ncbi:DinB family protein [Viridibacillus sp. NPDC093762]|uniref:DinB family protein n=1 Tax=Viridibacillus sp. NPDC093762 TaxID=3390720 RepID=UPI003D02E8F5
MEMSAIESKKLILNHYENSIHYIESLKRVSDDCWLIPIEESKWSVCEIVGHLVPWDNFVLEKRLPYLLNLKQELESPNVKEMNQIAALESRNISKDESIKNCRLTRIKLVSEISKIPASEFNKELNIGTSTLTVTAYFKGLIAHDLHHYQQIDEFLYKCNKN